VWPQVAKGEKQVEDCLTALDEAEAVLERAVRRKNREEQVLKLYQPLARRVQNGRARRDVAY
jgi:hypothetical protein